MPEININGVPPGVPPSGSSTFTGTVSDNPNRAADFDAARKAAQRPGSPGTEDAYDKALRQQDQQNRQQATAEARRRNQEEALYRRREQAEARMQRETERQRRAEMREHDQQRREEERARKEEQRRRERDSRAQEMLDRRQAGERNQRLRQEAMLSRQYSNLESRAGATQSPATYRAIQRASGNLNARVEDFQRRWGAAPFGVGSLPGLVGSMGSFENTYATQNINRLGNLGGRAANERDYRELVRIEHELRRIEKVNEKQLAATQGVTKEQKVNAQRNIEAIREARSKIATGRSGSSGLMNAAGNAIGGLSLIASNPYVDLAMAAAAFTVALPITTAKSMNLVMGMSKPYTDLRKQTAALGRAGGFNSMDLMNGLVTGGPASNMQKQLGMTPQLTAELLGEYGIATTSPDQAITTANDIRMASFQPMMGLSDKQLARNLRVARTLGVTQGGLSWSTGGFRGGGTYVGSSASSDADRYFEKLRKVMATATREGLDHSDVAAGFNNLLIMGARSGAVGVNAGAMANFQGTLMSSGLPGMRSGEGITAALAGMNQAIGQTGVGGAPAQNLMWMTYFNRNGGMPKTAAGLGKFLGWSDSEMQSQMSNPTTKTMIDNYLRAAQGGNAAFALSYLQPFLMNRPDLVQQAFSGSAFGGANPMIRPMIGGNMTGLGYEGFTAASSGRGPATAPGRISMPNAPIGSALSNAAAASGLPLWMVQGLGASESSFNPTATNGSHIGLFQLGREVRSDYGISAADAYDPEKNANVGARYFKKMLDSFPADDPDRLRHAIIRYKGGGTVQDIMAGRYDPKVGDEAQTALGLMFSYSNVPGRVNAAEANQGQANVGAGKYVFDTVGQSVGGGVGDLALRASGGVEEAATVTVKALGSMEAAISNFAHSLMSNANRINAAAGPSGRGAAASPAPSRP